MGGRGGRSARQGMGGSLSGSRGHVPGIERVASGFSDGKGGFCPRVYFYYFFKDVQFAIDRSEILRR